MKRCDCLPWCLVFLLLGLILGAFWMAACAPPPDLPLYGVKSHAWAALALALTFAETRTT